MSHRATSEVILIVDDDEDDCLLLRQALADARPSVQVRTLLDPERLLAYLRQQAPYEAPEDAPRPDLILLDLNMPRMDGREILALLKGDDALRRIPVVVLTTSRAARDVREVYGLGANAFVTKPVVYDGLVETCAAC